MARAPRFRAKSTAARASARLTPRRRKPTRVMKHVTAHTLSSLLSSARPSRDAGLEQQARVGGAWRDRAPADGLAVDVRDQAARRAGLRVPTFGLRPEPEGELLGANGGPRLSGLHLVSLALTSRRISARAEHGLEILPARLARRQNRDLGRRRHVGHADTYCPSAKGELLLCASVGNCSFKQARSSTPSRVSGNAVMERLRRLRALRGPAGVVRGAV